MRTGFLLVSIVCMLSACDFQTESAQDSLYPRASGPVNDFAGVLSAAEEEALLSRIRAYQEETSRQIALVTLDSIPAGQVKEFYFMELANEWGVGKAEISNGLLIGLSIDDRFARISTGLGTEKLLTNEECQAILDGIMIPAFKREEFFSGFNDAIFALTEAWGPITERELENR